MALKLKPLVHLNYSVLQETLTHIGPLVDQALFQIIQNQIDTPILKEAMNYAVLNGGKRFRPLLVKASADLFDLNFKDMLPVAVAVELIHAYSLVHDDLPAMDNADMRRGKPSCWRQYDETTAILVGDGLLTLAFEVLGNASLPALTIVDLVKNLARASGPSGMVAGQVLDLQQSHDNNLSAVEELQRLKTGALISFCCQVGAIAAQASPQQRQICQEIGYRLGLIYQMVDDLLDKQGEKEKLGKPTQQDADKETLVSLLGVEKATKRINDCQAHIENLLLPFGKKAALLLKIVNWAVQRRN